MPEDWTEQRRGALREVIRHCLYGVDANPLAVDLCKLALWLEGHEPDRPLTFLDHRIKLGNSLIGASRELLAEGLPDGAFDPVSGDDRAFATALKQRNKKERPDQLSLLAPDPWQADSHALGLEMQRIGDLPEDAALQVHEQRAAYVTFEQERFDIENRKPYFEAVDSRTKFCLLTLSGHRVEQSDLAFMLTDTDNLRDERRRFQLGPADFALLNPNTRTCPIFRTGADAELTRAIYRRVPVLIDERTGANPWGVEFKQGLFNMTADSGLFYNEPGPGRLPLYEAKLFHQFNHRWATYESWGAVRDATPQELADPGFAVTSRYWVDTWEVEERLKGKWGRGWLLAFRDIARNTDERTAIFSVLPRAGAGNNAPLMLADGASGERAAALVGCLNSVVFDYAARPKVGGTHLNFFVVNQLAVLPPSAYTPADLAFIVPRVLELVYTAWDLQPFARDLGYEGAPFGWDEERRAVVRAELDAWYAALYGLTREELRYVLDPSDVYGPEFPGETFRVLQSNEVKRHREYLRDGWSQAMWDRLRLGPPPQNHLGTMAARTTSDSLVDRCQATGLDVVDESGDRGILQQQWALAQRRHIFAHTLRKVTERQKVNVPGVDAETCANLPPQIVVAEGQHAAFRMVDHDDFTGAEQLL